MIGSHNENLDIHPCQGPCSSRQSCWSWGDRGLAKPPGLVKTVLWQDHIGYEQGFFDLFVNCVECDIWILWKLYMRSWSQGRALLIWVQQGTVDSARQRHHLNQTLHEALVYKELLNDSFFHISRRIYCWLYILSSYFHQDHTNFCSCLIHSWTNSNLAICVKHISFSCIMKDIKFVQSEIGLCFYCHVGWLCCIPGSRWSSPLSTD